MQEQAVYELVSMMLGNVEMARCRTKITSAHRGSVRNGPFVTTLSGP
jgi:hypothetical protein